MRSFRNLVIFAGILAITVFSIGVVWPGYPQRYLPDWVNYPEGPIFNIGGREAMRLGLDLKGGTYVLTEGDVSALPPGTDVDQAMDGARDIIERRVNAFGIAETEVTREGKNRLAIQLPGIPPDEAAELIGRTALLQFAQPVKNEVGDVRCRTEDGQTFHVDGNPLAGLVSLTETETGRNVVTCAGPEGQQGEMDWEPATGADSQGEQRVLTGRFIRAGSAFADILPAEGPAVVFQFTGEGSLLFQEITTRNTNYMLGIFLDDDLISAPRVPGPITGGQTQIVGMTLDEAQTLAIQLNAGALPIPLVTLSTTEVDATLGERTLVRGVQAGIIGVLAVMAFMILYYRLPGLLAAGALLTYISVVMMLFKTGPLIGPVTITLAGIAGFVLSVGMAVDANILVFERMKEELRAGRNLASAIEHGFNRAWSSIRDSNVSTLITCAILYWFGDQFGAALVKGFALTLGIGVLISMFSAIIVTRTFLRLLTGTGVSRRLWLFAPDLRPGGQPTMEPRKPFIFDFVKRRAVFFGLSALILLPGIISLGIPPAIKPGIEFTSGATMTLRFEDENVTQQMVNDAFREVGRPEARVQRTSEGDFIVRTSELAGPVGPPVGPAPPSERDDLERGLREQLGDFRTLNFNQVSEIISREVARDAGIAVAVAAIAILLYISWSFRHVPKAYRYGAAAVVAAGHDALFVLGAFSIFGKLFGTEVNAMFITGVLTVIGYSVHDTIVTFDRVRENALLNPQTPFPTVVNMALTETISRSLNTSATLVFTIMALLLLGAGAINVLLLTLLLGVIAGAYSSMFIAAQFLVSWEEGDFARLFRRVFPVRERDREPVPAEA